VWPIEGQYRISKSGDGQTRPKQSRIRNLPYFLKLPSNHNSARDTPLLPHLLLVSSVCNAEEIRRRPTERQRGRDDEHQ
jgi:hypothetical protein